MKKHIFLFSSNTEYNIYDVIKLILSTSIGVFIGLNANHILNFTYKNVIKIGNEQYILFIVAVLLCLIVDFIVCDIPEYIIDIIYWIIQKINIFKFKIKNNIIVNIVLWIIKIMNYMYICGICFFVIINILRFGEPHVIKWYDNLHVYKLSDNIVNKLVDNEYMQYFIRKNELYNGVNMDKAMEVTDDIVNTAKKITVESEKDIDKARILYNWVGSNIKYDKSLADNIINEHIEEVYGAKYAYYNRSGVCFDFSTLFGAMANAIGMPVKVVIGEAFNGIEYGPHAWNELYLEDEGRWINIDTTFWGDAYSFDSEYFNVTHEKDKIAWQNAR